MDFVIWEWISLFLRWTHAIAAIAWIGSSFYFVHLDQSIRQGDALPRDAHGEDWQIHGGGFYHMVKYLLPPPGLPEQVTWFKWEAYATWLSGFALLTVVYYCSADLYLIDHGRFPLTSAQAIAISIGGIVGAWAIYNLLCRSPLRSNDLAIGLVGFVLLVAMSYGYAHVFSGRGAFMQMGATMGTLMAANVFFVIIPNQRRTVADLLAGRTADVALGLAGKQRSLHNNYMTLPVVFVMIGSHFPLAFATPYAWVILALVMIMGGMIRYFYNTRHRGYPSPWWTWGVAAACGLVIVWVSSLGASTISAAPPPGPKADSDVASAAEAIVLGRCSMCHASEPTWPGVKIAPKGVRLDTSAEITAHARAIRLQAVTTRAMPPGNITEITEEERQSLSLWLATLE